MTIKKATNPLEPKYLIAISENEMVLLLSAVANGFDYCKLNNHDDEADDIRNIMFGLKEAYMRTNC